MAELEEIGLSWGEAQATAKIVALCEDEEDKKRKTMSNLSYTR